MWLRSLLLLTSVVYQQLLRTACLRLVWIFSTGLDCPAWSNHPLRLCLQDTDEANVLPEADVAMVARAIAASWEILIKNHALLLLPFLQSSGLDLPSIVCPMQLLPIVTWYARKQKATRCGDACYAPSDCSMITY